jgi:hypothetical protein
MRAPLLPPPLLPPPLLPQPLQLPQLLPLPQPLPLLPAVGAGAVASEADDAEGLAAVVFRAAGPAVAEFLPADALAAAAQAGDRGLHAAASHEAEWALRCAKDLGVKRPGHHGAGYFRALYLAVVEERLVEANSVGMGH